jgi:hypothetical protein
MMRVDFPRSASCSFSSNEVFCFHLFTFALPKGMPLDLGQTLTVLFAHSFVRVNCFVMMIILSCFVTSSILTMEIISKNKSERNGMVWVRMGNYGIEREEQPVTPNGGMCDVDVEAQEYSRNLEQLMIPEDEAERRVHGHSDNQIAHFLFTGIPETGIIAERIARVPELDAVSIEFDAGLAEMFSSVAFSLSACGYCSSALGETTPVAFGAAFLKHHHSRAFRALDFEVVEFFPVRGCKRGNVFGFCAAGNAGEVGLAQK